jgi:hypothetical protein
MLEEARTAICGPRYYAPGPERPASRAGTTCSEVVLRGTNAAKRNVKQWRNG